MQSIDRTEPKFNSYRHHVRSLESTKSGKKGSLRYVVALVGLLGALGVGWGWFFLTFVPRELRSLLS